MYLTANLGMVRVAFMAHGVRFGFILDTQRTYFERQRISRKWHDVIIAVRSCALVAGLFQSEDSKNRAIFEIGRMQRYKISRSGIHGRIKEGRMDLRNFYPFRAHR